MFIRRKFLEQAARGEMEDIQDNVAQLLTSRRGTGFFLPHFGVTDTGFRTPAEMATRLSEEIRENLRLFEPRVGVVEIEEDCLSDGCVQLGVHCRVLATGERMQIVMDSRGRLLRVGVEEELEPR